MPDETVSAVPEHLDGYVRVAHDVADSLSWRASALVDDLDALERDCRGVEVAFAPFDLGRAATGIVTELRSIAHRVGVVSGALKQADASPFITDIVTVAASSIPVPGDSPAEQGGALGRNTLLGENEVRVFAAIAAQHMQALSRCRPPRSRRGA